MKEVFSRLSVDMLSGAKLRRQANLVLYDALSKASCAWGAAIEFRLGTQAFRMSEKQVIDVIKKAGWGWTLTTIEKCPLCPRYAYIANLITHLNNPIEFNGHALKREKTASFLQKWENKLGITRIVKNPVAQYLKIPTGKIIPVKHMKVKAIRPTVEVKQTPVQAEVES